MNNRISFLFWLGACAASAGCNSVLGIEEPVERGPADASADQTAADADSAAPLDGQSEAQQEASVDADAQGDTLPDVAQDVLPDVGDEGDAAHCGALAESCCGGTDCESGLSCTAGTCSCAGGTTPCAGTCVDTSTDPQNCGSCGTTCLIGCSSAACVTIVSMEGGDNHTCAVLSDSSVRCWGRGVNGELGTGHWENSATPMRVKISDTADLTGALETSGGAQHNCVTMNDGTGVCWGSDNYGQLGNGGTSDSAYAAQGPGNLGAQMLSLIASDDFSCAAISDGAKTAWCWGKGNTGQLGQQLPSGIYSSTVPLQVPGLTGVVQVAGGYQSACGRLASGAVWCWGWNDYGQLGNGSTQTSFTPVQVTACGGGMLTGASYVACGARHCCAVGTGGSILCWGDGSDGELGAGIVDTQTCAGAIPGFTGAVRVGAGNGHTCSLTAAGLMHCWGSNSVGEVGTGGDPVTSPAQVLTGVAGISVGGDHTCANLGKGRAACWGRGDFGQIGNGVKGDKSTPTDVVW